MRKVQVSEYILIVVHLDYLTVKIQAPSDSITSGIIYQIMTSEASQLLDNKCAVILF